LSSIRVAFTGTSNQSENYSTGFIIDFGQVNSMSDNMKKREKLQSKGQQDNEDLSKGAESEKERSTKRPRTGA
jgi:hypothetical protein